MSKIALEGNSSGTGTLTIASQNTNTNYTITLPNETGTLVTSGTTTGINASALSTGTVAVARGGTGAGTLTAESVVIGNGTSAVKFVDPGTSGNVLTSNGTAWVSSAAGGDYIMNVYSTPGTWTKPAGLKAVKVTVVGGGGGSAGSGVLDQRGGGGAGGGASIEYIDAPAIPGPQPYTVGTGGTAGPTSAPGVGGTGGTSSFGGPTAFLSATGGSGGISSPGNSIGLSAAGTGSNGQLNIPGSPGGNGALGAGGTAVGFRGGSILGPTTGWINDNSSTNYPTPSGYGVGGLGCTPPNAGVAGSAGVIIVEEFY